MCGWSSLSYILNIFLWPAIYKKKTLINILNSQIMTHDPSTALIPLWWTYLSAPIWGGGAKTFSSCLTADEAATSIIIILLIILLLIIIQQWNRQKELEYFEKFLSLYVGFLCVTFLFTPQQFAMITICNNVFEWVRWYKPVICYSCNANILIQAAVEI